MQGLANQLSEAGAANLVEPRQLQLNTHWVEVEGKFTPFKRQYVSFTRHDFYTYSTNWKYNELDKFLILTTKSFKDTVWVYRKVH